MIILVENWDRTQPKPGGAAILRAGDLADRTTFVRTNLLFSENPLSFLNQNLYPHTFMLDSINPTNPNEDPNVKATVKAIALKAQYQIASFVASDETQVIDPDNVPPALAVPIFEVPIVPLLPETLNYFP